MKVLAEDLAILTTLGKYSIEKIVRLAMLSIGHDVYEGIEEKEPVTEIDIGIGVLYIIIEEEQIKYKFVPSKQLENVVTSAVVNKQSPLANRAEDVLVQRVQAAYKELI